MEESNIRYTGITQATSDLDCPDGDLSISHNIIRQNGAMRPIVLPDAAFTLGEGEKLLYVHSASGYKNYLYVENSTLKAFTFTENELRQDLTLNYVFSGDKINQIQSIGNTLIVFLEKSILYILYKNGDYKILGDELPDVYIQFGLTGRTRLFSYSDDSKSTFNITFDEISVWGEGSDVIYRTLSESNQVKVTEQIMPKINKFINEQVTKKGYFCFPFFNILVFLM